jgi:hypothetical protein
VAPKLRRLVSDDNRRCGGGGAAGGGGRVKGLDAKVPMLGVPSAGIMAPPPTSFKFEREDVKHKAWVTFRMRVLVQSACRIAMMRRWQMEEMQITASTPRVHGPLFEKPSGESAIFETEKKFQGGLLG